MTTKNTELFEACRPCLYPEDCGSHDDTCFCRLSSRNQGAERNGWNCASYAFFSADDSLVALSSLQQKVMASLCYGRKVTLNIKEHTMHNADGTMRRNTFYSPLRGFDRWKGTQVGYSLSTWAQIIKRKGSVFWSARNHIFKPGHGTRFFAPDWVNQHATMNGGRLAIEATVFIFMLTTALA